MFEPFFTTKPEGSGSGLGLSIVHGIVQQNDGRVEVLSTVAGGTTLEILLPAIEQTPQPESHQPPAEPVRKGKETVHVVEDEPSLLHLATPMLRSFGYEVQAAGSPQEALKLCRDGNAAFDLLLTDEVHFLQKPFSRQSLAEKVKEALHLGPSGE